MSPSKRADNKKMIGIYVDKNILRRFQAACDYFGLSMSTVLTSYIEDKANEYERLKRKERDATPQSKSTQED